MIVVQANVRQVTQSGRVSQELRCPDRHWLPRFSTRFWRFSALDAFKLPRNLPTADARHRCSALPGAANALQMPCKPLQLQRSRSPQSPH